MENSSSSKIIGTGSFVPERILTNKDLEKLMDTTDEWIQEKYGIKERHIAGDNENISDLSYYAAVKALKDADVAAEEIDLIILASINSDNRSPATACRVQGMLGASQAIAFDMNVGGCPNATFALTTALKFIDSERYRKVLVICTEIYSKFINWSHRNTACFLADGSGAVVLEACPADEGIMSHCLGGDGTKYDKAIWPGGGTVKVLEEEQTPQIDGKAIWNFGHTVVPEVIRETVSRANTSMNKVDFFIFHQANANIIYNVLDMLDVSKEKTLVNNDRFGNTGGASTLIALDEALRDGKIKKEDQVVICSYGAGLAWGALLLQM